MQSLFLIWPWTFCDALCSIRSSCLYYQVMDGDVCIQDTRSVADRRIHTQGRTTTCFKHRKNWRNCRITIFIVDELWFAVLKSEHCQNVWTISQAAMRRSLGINRSHSVSFRECLRLIFVCILPPKSCKTSEWDENDDSGPLCGGWHSKVGETRHSMVSTISPFSHHSLDWQIFFFYSD